MNVEIVEGDLLEQDVESIVNTWNRNILPWWLLLPQGVSGAIKKKGGCAPFRELRRFGVLRLGDAVVTSAGTLPYKAVIHVAGINLLWRGTETSIRASVRNAMQRVEEKEFRSVAFPIIGAGSGGFSREKALHIMLEEFGCLNSSVKVVVVKFARK